MERADKAAPALMVISHLEQFVASRTTFSLCKKKEMKRDSRAAGKKVTEKHAR
jgi:hypothetical protein